jgi:hypothetical protein
LIWKKVRNQFGESICEQERDEHKLYIDCQTNDFIVKNIEAEGIRLEIPVLISRIPQIVILHQFILTSCQTM